jgi:Arc/MetJ-type ribon-helix-helix transcriptional regulator
MAQINLHVGADFEASLEALMRGRGLRSKSEAIRLAVQEAAARYQAPPRRDFSQLQGLVARVLPKGAPVPRAADLEAEIDREMDRALRSPRPRR